MLFPLFDVSSLSSYSGRPEASYINEDFADTALLQASLLFRIATCLTEFPTDPDQALLARYAILSMADTLYLSQPYAIASASPFQSESIGSYSYSKGAKQIASQLPTGISWFDLAVQQMGVCDYGAGSGVHTGSTGVFEEDYEYFAAVDNKRRVVGPRDKDITDTPFSSSVQAPFQRDPNL